MIIGKFKLCARASFSNNNFNSESKNQIGIFYSYHDQIYFFSDNQGLDGNHPNAVLSVNESLKTKYKFAWNIGSTADLENSSYRVAIFSPVGFFTHEV